VKSFYLSTVNKPQIIWITGASSGIGEALTYAYAKREARVIISARRETELERVKAHCSANEANIHIVPIDLEQYHQASDWYKAAKQAFGTPDILINNGGIGHLGAALAMQPVVEQKVMDINFWGQVALSKAVLPDMLERGSGKLVIMSSLLGHYGTARLAAYAASKHALLGYFESLREELAGSGVEILLVSPGFVNTQVPLISLTARGEKYIQYCVAREKGMNPNLFADKLIRAINSKKKYAYIGGKELMAIPFKRIAPNLFYKVYNWLAQRAKTT
jgi:dehydrogenase/reductase SDR family protein 7B